MYYMYIFYMCTSILCYLDMNFNKSLIVSGDHVVVQTNVPIWPWFKDI